MKIKEFIDLLNTLEFKEFDFSFRINIHGATGSDVYFEDIKKIAENYNAEHYTFILNED